MSDMKLRRAYISLGSNMGDKRAQIALALEHLDSTPSIKVVSRSHDYRTPPWGETDQDWFVNACAALDTSLSAQDLLSACLAIETRMGRTRTRKWGPRVIDIDVLDYEGQILKSDHLTLPHPHVLDRAFVLIPLVEIAGDLVISGQNIRKRALQLNDPSITVYDN